MPNRKVMPVALESRKARLLVQIGALADLRPGSLVERFLKCGKAGCHCAQPGDQGHGPFWSLTRKVNGKTATWLVPAGKPQQVVRDQVEEYKRFRALEKELIEVCEQLSDARLEAIGTAPANLAKKGASRKPSRAPSKGKSRHS